MKSFLCSMVAWCTDAVNLPDVSLLRSKQHRCDMSEIRVSAPICLNFDLGRKAYVHSTQIFCTLDSNSCASKFVTTWPCDLWSQLRHIHILLLVGLPSLVPISEAFDRLSPAASAMFFAGYSNCLVKNSLTCARFYLVQKIALKIVIFCISSHRVRMGSPTSKIGKK